MRFQVVSWGRWTSIHNLALSCDRAEEGARQSHHGQCSPAARVILACVRGFITIYWWAKIRSPLHHPPLLSARTVVDKSNQYSDSDLTPDHLHNAKDHDQKLQSIRPVVLPSARTVSDRWPIHIADVLTLLSCRVGIACMSHVGTTTTEASRMATSSMPAACTPSTQGHGNGPAIGGTAAQPLNYLERRRKGSSPSIWSTHEGTRDCLARQNSLKPSPNRPWKWGHINIRA
jgi:hypothetical protein